MATQVAAHPGWNLPRLAYGDWSWLIRDGLDVLRLAFIGGTVVFALQGRSTAGALTAASAVLLIARIIDLPRWFDFGLTITTTAIAWGTALGLYGDYWFYDKIVHGISPIGYAPVLYIAFARLGVLPDPDRAIRVRKLARVSGVFLVTLAIGMAVGAGYENIEWIEDEFNLLGGHFVKGLWDTETDLLCDTAGSLIGAGLLTVWSIRGWSTRRQTVVPVPAPKLTPIAAAAEQLRRNRLTGLSRAAQGAVALGAGVLLLALPAPGTRTVGIVFGVALLGSSAFGLFGLLRQGRRAEHHARLAELAAFAVAGTLVLSWPSISQLALLHTAGALAVGMAILEAAALSSTRGNARGQWLGGVVSVTLLVFGVALLARPARSFDAAVTLLGVYLVALGALRLWHALEARLGEARRS